LNIIPYVVGETYDPVPVVLTGTVLAAVWSAQLEVSVPAVFVQVMTLVAEMLGMSVVTLVVMVVMLAILLLSKAVVDGIPDSGGFGVVEIGATLLPMVG